MVYTEREAEDPVGWSHIHSVHFESGFESVFILSLSQDLSLCLSEGLSLVLCSGLSQVFESDFESGFKSVIESRFESMFYVRV